MEGDNDDDELSFVTLLAATRDVVQWLQIHEQQNKQREDQPNAGNDLSRARKK